MRKKSNPRKSQPTPVSCEEVRFAEVEFPLPVEPRLVVRFSDGLSLLVDDPVAIDLAAEFIVSFRAHEMKKGGRR